MDGDYAQWVRLRRNAAGLTQRQLAERAGVKQPLIAAIEASKRTATSQVKTTLNQALAIRPTTLLRHLSNEVSATITKAGAKNPRVFGSVARGDDHPGSDIDLLVSFGPEADIVTLLDLEHELSQLLTVPVDVVSDQGESAILAKARRQAVPL